MSNYYENIQKGLYNYAKAGEVCSVAEAKRIGIFEASKYFKGLDGNLKTLKTFNPAIDAAGSRYDEVCTQNVDGTQAYPTCLLSESAGAGPGFVKKLGAPGTCVAAGCPTGFEDTRGTCKKPLKDAIVSKLARCDERWSDWFMIPNYHLGNGYWAKQPGQCYAPCPPGSVPFFNKDRVDGEAVDFTTEEDRTKCISREEYFDGKYVQGSEYCPLAWIHRLGNTARDMELSMQTVYDGVAETTGESKNTHMVELEKARKEQARALMTKAGSQLEAVEVPSQAQSRACAKLATSDRLITAYDICAAIRDNEDAFAKKLEDENGDDVNAQGRKIMVLKKACDALFCNEVNDPYVAEGIGRDPLCFKNVKDVDLAEGTEPPKTPDAPTAQSGQRFLYKSIGTSIKIVFMLTFGVLLYFFWTLFLWPKIVLPILQFIKRIITGWKSSEYAGKFDEALELAASVKKK